MYTYLGLQNMKCGDWIIEFQSLTLTKIVLWFPTSSGKDLIEFNQFFLELTECIQVESKASFSINHITKKIKVLAQSFKNFHIAHSYSEPNIVPNKLANIGMKSDKIITWRDTNNKSDDLINTIIVEKIFLEKGSSLTSIKMTLKGK